jgi:hypothetical protein
MLTMTSSFSHWLKQHRSRDLAQDELVKWIGCSSDLVRKIEAGRRRPSRYIAECVTKALEIAPENRAQFVRYADVETGDLTASEKTVASVQVAVAAEAVDTVQQRMKICRRHTPCSLAASRSWRRLERCCARRICVCSHSPAPVSRQDATGAASRGRSARPLRQ